MGNVNRKASKEEMASAYRGMLVKNLNPIEVRRAEQRRQAAGRTFGEVANELHNSRKGGWKPC